MCSNPSRGFRRLLTSSDSQTFSQVRGAKAMKTVLDIPRGQEIPYSPKRHLSPDHIEQIVAGYLAGTTARELGKRFEVDRTTVSGILKSNGVTMRQHPMQTAEIEQAIQLYKSGWSLVKIAERIPYDPSTIWRTLRLRRVEMRNPQREASPEDGGCAAANSSRIDRAHDTISDG